MNQRKESKIWLITDTHFNHDKIKEYCGRPDDCDEQMIKNCKKVIQDHDLLIHLGDVIISRASELKGIMDQIPGTKVLTLGNHDQKRPHWYRNNGFDFVCTEFVMNGILFSHFPLHKRGDCKMNIHGHFHNAKPSHREKEFTDIYDETWHRLLAVEHEDYKPVDLIEFINRQP